MNYYERIDSNIGKLLINSFKSRLNYRDIYTKKINIYNDIFVYRKKICCK